MIHSSDSPPRAVSRVVFSASQIRQTDIDIEDTFEFPLVFRISPCSKGGETRVLSPPRLAGSNERCASVFAGETGFETISQTELQFRV
jgi:hypothetical protein